MADEKYTIPDNPQYIISDIRKLQDTDPASATQTFNPLIEALVETLAYLQKHKAGLDATGKVPENQLPEMNYVPNGEKGKPSGVATLGADGKVPAGQLPEMNYEQAGAAAAVQQNLNSHTGNKNNPHGVTATDVGALPANGTAAAANKLATPRTIQTNLGSTAAPDFDGTKNVTPGVTGVLPVANGGTGNSSGYVRTGHRVDITIGQNATAEGSGVVSSGNCAHAEGMSTIANANYAHAEGWDTRATALAAHSEGMETKSSNCCSHAGGKSNKPMAEGGDYYNKIGDVFVIGNGSPGATSNAFRVTYAGETYGLTSFKTSGADYAEYFEWQDGNPQAEDRVGRFVTMSGKHIKTAAPGDYILGVVSGQPCIIGNADEDWLGRWEHDDFGRFVKRYMVEDKTEIDPPADEEARMELLHDPQVREEDSKLYRLTPRFVDYETPSWDYKPNPDYDSSQPYIERRDRQEWDAVGMLGVLPVWDDGTCQPDGYCQPAENGTATAAESYIPGQTYRVIERVSENVVKIVFR